MVVRRKVVVEEVLHGEREERGWGSEHRGV